MSLIPNKIKYSGVNDGNCIYVNNYAVGVSSDGRYGPTSETGYWMGIAISGASGYTVYENKPEKGPSIHTPRNDEGIIWYANYLGAGGVTTAADAIYWINNQNDRFVANIDYPNIVTSGLTFLFDASYTGSYPRTGDTWNNLGFNGLDLLWNDTGGYPNPDLVLSGNGYFKFTYEDIYGNPFFTNSFFQNFDYPNQFSIESWVSFSNINTAITNPYFFNLRDTDYFLYYLYDGVYFGFRNQEGMFSQIKIIDVGDIILNKWYHFAGVFDGYYLKGYVDGNNTISDSVGMYYPGKYGNVDPPVYFDVARGYGYDPGFFNGCISNVKFYSRDLSQEEIKRNYNAHATPLGIINDSLWIQYDPYNFASYPRTGNTIFSLVPPDNFSPFNGTMTNGPYFLYENGGAIKFDGSNDYVSINSYFGSGFYPWVTSFSVNLWFKTTTSGGTIFGQQNTLAPSSATKYVPAIYINSNGKLVTSCFSGSSVNDVQTSSSVVADGLWHNVVVTYSAVTAVAFSGTGDYTTYLDGVSLGTVTKTQIAYNSYQYYYNLGGGKSFGWPGSNGDYFNGSLGYFSFYVYRTLTSSEVLENYKYLKYRYCII